MVIAETAPVVAAAAGRQSYLPRMQKTITVLLMIARLLFAIQVLVGFAIWFGVASLVAFHAAVGSLFVLDMWIIAVIALFALSSRGVALIALIWGAMVLWLGMAQVSLLPGSVHWAVRLVHLLVGIAAMGLVESLSKAVKRHWVVRANAT